MIVQWSESVDKDGFTIYEIVSEIRTTISGYKAKISYVIRQRYDEEKEEIIYVLYESYTTYHDEYYNPSRPRTSYSYILHHTNLAAVKAKAGEYYNCYSNGMFKD